MDTALRRADPAIRWWSGEGMGTLVQVGVADPVASEVDLAAAPRLLHEVEAELSRFRPDSDVSMLNNSPGCWVPIGTHLRPVMLAAARATRVTAGSFDVISGPAVEDPPLRLRFRQHSGRWEANLAPGQRIDLGGIAKGYTADLIRDQFRAAGVLVTIGSSSIGTAGRPEPTRPWRVALRSPWADLSGVLGYLEMEGGSLSVSGVDGHRIGSGPVVPPHLVDPHTGQRPESDLCTVGVLAGDGMTAEAWSTALMIRGLDQSLVDCHQHGLEAVFLTASGEVRATPGLADRLALKRGVVGVLGRLRARGAPS